MTSALLNYEQAIVLDPTSSEAMQGLLQVYGEGKITRPMLLRMEQLRGERQEPVGPDGVDGTLVCRTRLDAAMRFAVCAGPARWTRSAAPRLRKWQSCWPATEQMVAAVDSATRVHEFSTLLAGVKADRDHDTAEAVRNYEAAVHGGDSSGISANNLAWIYARQGRELDRALALAKHACELAPEDPAVLDTLGAVHLARREYSSAVGVLELARTLAESRGQSERRRAGGDQASSCQRRIGGRGKPSGLRFEPTTRKSSP